MTKIFVAKLDFGVSNDQLKSLFEAYGKVLKATVATDRETGKPRGFAFVEMLNESEASEAIKQLDGFQINGRNIAVKVAEDRPKNGTRPNHSPRNDFSFQKKNTTEESKPDKSINAPSINPQEIQNFKTNTRKKSNKERDRGDSEKDGNNKKTKMNAYKKSNKYKFDFDEDEEIEGGLFSFNNDDEEDYD